MTMKCVKGSGKHGVMFFTVSNGKDVRVVANVQMYRITDFLMVKSECQHLRYVDVVVHE